MGNNILAGKSAVVTGAGRGIGKAIALALAAQGAKVVVNDLGTGRDGRGEERSPADQVVAEIRAAGGAAVSNYESVVDFNAAERIIQTCVSNFGRLDILVNNAGVLRERMIYNMSYDDWQTVINTHLTGSFNCARHACVVMKEQRYGRIVNMTSEAFRGTVGQCNYGAAKGGIVSLTKSIAREMGRFNVTCNAVAPRAATRMTLDPAVLEGVKKRFERGLIDRATYEEAFNRLGPEHIPPIIVYLCSDQAANINGQVFGTSKGRVVLYSPMDETKGIYTEDAWTDERLMNVVPRTLALGMVNQFAKTE